MANWWDTMGTTIGDNLIGMQMPFGMAPPTDPQQRAAMINPMLVNIGATMLANRGKNPAANLGLGLVNAQQAGMDQLGKSLYARQIMNSEEDRKKDREDANRTRQWALTQPWAKNYPIDTMSGEDIFRVAMGANKPPDMPSSYDEFKLAQQNPAYAQYLQQGKGADKLRTQKTQINGHDVLMNLDTGEIMKDYGPTQSRAQTVPGAVQTDLIKAKQAYGTVNAALDRFEKAATAAGTWGSTMPGAQKDAVGEERRNVQLMLKEMYNLGVLNGPDLELMDTMLFDPSLSATDPIGSISKMAGGTGQRVSASVARMKQRLKEMVESKIAVVKASSAANGGDSMSVEPPADVDPALWEAMTPEEQALWQTSQ